MEVYVLVLCKFNVKEALNSKEAINRGRKRVDEKKGPKREKTLR